MRGHNGDHKNRMFFRLRSRAGAPSRWRPAVDDGQPQVPVGFTISALFLKLWLLATLPFARLSARRQTAELNEPSVGLAQRPPAEEPPDLDEAERLARIRRINAAAAKDEAAAEKLKKETALLPQKERETKLHAENLELDLALKIIGLGIGIGTVIAACVLGIFDLGQPNGHWSQPWSIWEPPAWLWPR